MLYKDIYVIGKEKLIMKIQISDHFTLKKLLRFVLPSIIMMIFTSIYSVIDGLFISNFAGKTPFASANLIMPFIMILGAIGFMLGTGGSAIVSKTLGEEKRDKANEYFSLIIVVVITTGIIIAIVGAILMNMIARLLGADSEMLGYCVLYGRIVMISLPAFMLQNVFQSFLVTSGKPQLGLAVIVMAGVTNIILDAVFVAGFHMGIAGAALATVIGEFIGGLVPLFYFLHENSSLLHLVRPKKEWRILLKACTNGSSEFLTNISMSLVNMLYNFQLMRIAGANGIAAYGVIMYANFIFCAIFLGYSIGTAPLVGFNYGAGNHPELQNLFRKSLCLIGCTGIFLTITAILLSSPLARLFVGYDAELFAMTSHGFKLYAIAFLFNGFSIFGSSFFTALNNGAVSAAISFLRTLVFQITAVLLLPIWLGLNGIWLSIVAAEILALFVTIAFFVRKAKVYHYMA